MHRKALAWLIVAEQANHCCRENWSSRDQTTWTIWSNCPSALAGQWIVPCVFILRRKWMSRQLGARASVLLQFFPRLERSEAKERSEEKWNPCEAAQEWLFEPLILGFVKNIDEHQRLAILETQSWHNFHFWTALLWDPTFRWPAPCTVEHRPVLGCLGIWPLLIV